LKTGTSELAGFSHRTWLLLIVAVLALPISTSGFEIERAGKIQLAHGVHLFAFSTDPTIQEVLSQDFSAERRSTERSSDSTVTLSVNVSQQALRPGVSLNQVAPGDPQVADLLSAAGVSPPPLGDTGAQYDQAAMARHMAQRDLMPHDTISQQMINSISQPGSYQRFGGGNPPIPLPCAVQSVARPGCPPAPQESPTPARSRPAGDVQRYLDRRERVRTLFGSPADTDYDTVIIARVSVSSAPDEMTLVAVSHPGEDLNEVKKHLAERIADSVLH